MRMGKKIDWNGNGIFIVVLIIIIGIAIFAFRGSKDSGNPEADVYTTKKNFIPYANYTCEDLIPERLNIPLQGGIPTFFGGVKLNNNFIMTGSYCKQTIIVGEKIGPFKCEGMTRNQKSISDEGIVLRDYLIFYDFSFDNSECDTSHFTAGYGYVDCKVLNFSCYWEYWK